jgi:hypothetical protein
VEFQSEKDQAGAARLLETLARQERADRRARRLVVVLGWAGVALGAAAWAFFPAATGAAVIALAGGFLVVALVLSIGRRCGK